MPRANWPPSNIDLSKQPSKDEIGPPCIRTPRNAAELRQWIFERYATLEMSEMAQASFGQGDRSTGDTVQHAWEFAEHVGLKGYPPQPKSPPNGWTFRAEREALDDLRHWLDCRRTHTAGERKRSKRKSRGSKQRFSGIATAPGLAKRFHVPLPALTQRLKRFRHGHANGWHEVPNDARQQRGPRWVYDVAAVMPVIHKLQSSAKRRSRKKS